MVENVERSRRKDADALLVFVTCPADEAGNLAQEVVEAGYAACVNTVAGIHSVYRWQGGIEEGDESLLIIKTVSEKYPMLETLIVSLHPYSCPEIIAVRIDRGLPAYLAWLSESVGGAGGGKKG